MRERENGCVCVCVCVCVDRLRASAPHGCMSPLVARRVCRARPAAGSQPSRAWLRLVPSSGYTRLAAGVTWRLVIASAPWAARFGHTSVVGAAGAIYVLGGGRYGFTGYLNDVWASPDGGAGRASGTRWGYLVGPRGYSWCYRGTRGYSQGTGTALRTVIGVANSPYKCMCRCHCTNKNVLRVLRQEFECVRVRVCLRLRMRVRGCLLVFVCV